jgi:hypothetical protein
MSQQRFEPSISKIGIKSITLMPNDLIEAALLNNL